MNEHAALFDAVELNAMRTRVFDPNRRAIRWAARHGKPMVGTSDVHLLAQMGTTYSLVDAEPDPDAICQAVRAGRVEVRTEPLSTFRAATILTRIVTMGWGSRG
jgi:predicted metal-dependent phosphoesterase TrpH